MGPDVIIKMLDTINSRGTPKHVACTNTTTKEVAFTRIENDRLTLKNAAFCIHSLSFSDRKIRGFPFVFQTVNSSFRSIIRQFSTTVNSRKTSRFTGVHCIINPLKNDCFSLCCLRFPVTKQLVKWCLLETAERLQNLINSQCI